jgi:phage gp45-like
MRILVAFTLLTMVALSAIAGSKDSGSTTLNDVQPTGTTDKKHKNQRFDLSFASSGKDYVCRTTEKTKVKATDLVVGSTVNYQIDGDKGKIKTSGGKQFNCTIVRVANAAEALK